MGSPWPKPQDGVTSDQTPEDDIPGIDESQSEVERPESRVFHQAGSLRFSIRLCSGKECACGAQNCGRNSINIALAQEAKRLPGNSCQAA